MAWSAPANLIINQLFTIKSNSYGSITKAIIFKKNDKFTLDNPSCLVLLYFFIHCEFEVVLYVLNIISHKFSIESNKISELVCCINCYSYYNHNKGSIFR